MAQIQPFAEVAGEEHGVLIIGDDVMDRSRTRPDGNLFEPDGVPVERVLSEARGDRYRVPLSPRNKELLAGLDDLDGATRRHLARGFVDIPIVHLRDLAPATRVRVGYRLYFSKSEIEALGL